jgi:hypothetical protein
MPPPPPSLIPDIRDAEDSSDWMPWIPILLIACGIALIPVALAAYCCYANIKEQRPNSVAHATGGKSFYPICDSHRRQRQILKDKEKERERTSANEVILFSLFS